MIPIYRKLKNTRGQNLHLKIWENGSPMWIVHIHGLGEHTERHQFLYDIFSEDFNICSFDLAGHGKSDGVRASIDNMTDFSDDLEGILAFLQESYALADYILMGHSMGGLISTLFLKYKKDSTLEPRAVFLSSPALGQAGWMRKIVNYLSFDFFKRLAHIKKGLHVKGILNINRLSHNEVIYRDYVSDPLNSLKISTKLLFNIVAAGKDIKNGFGHKQIPIWGAVGTEDTLVCCEEIKVFFEKNSSLDRLKLIKHGYHELHNEIGQYKEEYFAFLRKTLLTIRYEGYESL